LFFYLFTFAINLWHRKFVTADDTVVSVNNEHGIKRQGQDFDKKSLYLKGYTVKRLTEEFPEKSWTKRGVNKLFKTFHVIQAQLTGGQEVKDRAVTALKKMLNFFFRSPTVFH